MKMVFGGGGGREKGIVIYFGGEGVVGEKR